MRDESLDYWNGARDMALVVYNAVRAANAPGKVQAIGWRMYVAASTRASVELRAELEELMEGARRGSSAALARSAGASLRARGRARARRPA